MGPELHLHNYERTNADQRIDISGISWGAKNGFPRTRIRFPTREEHAGFKLNSKDRSQHM